MEKIIALLRETVSSQASDLFLTVGIPPMIKVAGSIRPIEDHPNISQKEAETYARQLFTKERDYQTFLEYGEVDFSFSLAEVGRFRVNIFQQRGSYAVSVRRVYSDLPKPASLGIPESVMKLADKQNGLILVTGPTGCGKSTTLAALIDRINQTRSCHILTLEDPIEYLHRHRHSIVNQREIGSDSQNYQRALRAAMRQSPDVILIGEMRDLETIGIALTAAETGHLVLSTLHTIGAAKTIDRIIDVFPPDQQQQIKVQLSTVLEAVVSQQLVPSLQGDRVPAFEIMIVNSAIRNMIREGKVPQIDGVIQMNAAQGMATMDKSLADLLREGLISQSEAILHSVNPDAVRRLAALPLERSI